MSKKHKKEQGDPMMDRLLAIHEAFIGLKLGEMEIRSRLESWLNTEEDYQVCSDIIDMCADSDDRADRATEGLSRVAELSRKGATWLRLFKKEH